MPKLSNQVIAEALTGAVADTLNLLGAAEGLAPLLWTLDATCDLEFHGVHPEGEAHPDGKQLCHQWAELLGLREGGGVEGQWGYYAWRGKPGDWDLQVSWIYDVEIFNAANPDDQVTLPGGPTPAG